jgi:hypothetical protein
MEDKLNVGEILANLGYTLKDFGKEYRARPIYRDSDNDTVLRIYKDSGNWVDFKENISGDFTSLVKLSLKLDTQDQAKAWLKDKNFTPTFIKDVRPEIKSPKTFDKELLLKLKKDHSYWINRNVSEETLNLFLGGVAENGKMKNRYVFPIFNSKKEIVGFSGRDITNKSKIKWKHLGDKVGWCYPNFLNLEEIKSKREAILIESVGDCLALWDAGVKNTIVTFGLEISISILNLLLKLDPNKIYISFNNDQQKNNAGNDAAEKGKNKLLRYFDPRQIEIKLPNKKDFGEMPLEEIVKWYKNT